jgi:signal transduction histidine kinase
MRATAEPTGAYARGRAVPHLTRTGTPVALIAGGRVIEAGSDHCQLSVVVPTRNESSNVTALFSRLSASLSSGGLEWEVIFVDDSDDGTAEEVRQLATGNAAVRLLHRPVGARQGGLGGAVNAGFELARGQVLAVMDGDLQHPPEALAAIIAPVLSGEADLAAGNRYAWAGGTAGLAGWRRHLVSRACRALVHVAVPSSRLLDDPLGGLFAVRRSVLDGVALAPRGYKILLEVVARAQPRSVRNIGFDFDRRQAGSSKADLREGLVFLGQVGLLAATDRQPVPSGPTPEDDITVGTRGSPGQRAMRVVGRHRLLADAAVALAVALASAGWLAHRPGAGLGAWALQAGLVAPLIGRHRYPVAVFALISVVAFAQWLIGTVLIADIAVLASLYTVARYRPRAVAAAAALIVEVGVVMASVRWDLAGSWLRSSVFLSGLACSAVLMGANQRARQARLGALSERAKRLERERDQQGLLAAAAERARIAREMHDVIAHSLTAMISLADGAAAKLRSKPEQAGAAIANVSEIGRQALGDTRRLLGVLRADGDDDGLAPQPGVAQIERLLTQVRATGLTTSLRAQGLVRPLAPGLELVVYRVVQEAATNTLKHAIRATQLLVELDYGDNVIVVSVSDDGRPVPPPALCGDTPARGHGLAGLRERASLYNGDVTAGARPDGWSVRARLEIAPGSNSGRAPVPAGARRPSCS